MMPTIRQLKKASKAIKDRRIEIDGRVRYIPLPGRPHHSHGPKTGLKRGKRRAKGKARPNRELALVPCKRSELLPRPPLWKPDVFSLSPFIAERKVHYLNMSKPGLLTVQPMFRHVAAMPFIARMREMIETPPVPIDGLRDGPPLIPYSKDPDVKPTDPFDFSALLN